MLLDDPGAFPVVQHIPWHLSIPMGLPHSQNLSPAWLLDVTPNESVPVWQAKALGSKSVFWRRKMQMVFHRQEITTGTAVGGGRNKTGFRRTTDLEFLEIQLLCHVPSSYMVSVFCHGSTDCFDQLTEGKMFKCVYHWLSLNLWWNGDFFLKNVFHEFEDSRIKSFFFC